MRRMATNQPIILQFAGKLARIESRKWERATQSGLSQADLLTRNATAGGYPPGADSPNLSQGDPGLESGEPALYAGGSQDRCITSEQWQQKGQGHDCTGRATPLRGG